MRNQTSPRLGISRRLRRLGALEACRRWQSDLVNLRRHFHWQRETLTVAEDRERHLPLRVALRAEPWEAHSGVDQIGPGMRRTAMC